MKFLVMLPTCSSLYSGRFVLLPRALNDMIEEEENLNTKGKTERDLKLFRGFLETKENMNIREVENIPAPELNEYLSEFIFCIRRKDGKEYEPCSIRGILASIQRYLMGKN